MFEHAQPEVAQGRFVFFVDEVLSLVHAVAAPCDQYRYVPALMTGIRISSGLAVIGAIVADFFFNQGDKGIGFFIRVTQQKAANRPDMLAGTIVCVPPVIEKSETTPVVPE